MSGSWYLAARLAVTSWVRSPNSATRMTRKLVLATRRNVGRLPSAMARFSSSSPCRPRSSSTAPSRNSAPTTACSSRCGSRVSRLPSGHGERDVHQERGRGPGRRRAAAGSGCRAPGWRGRSCRAAPRGRSGRRRCRARRSSWRVRDPYGGAAPKARGEASARQRSGCGRRSRPAPQPGALGAGPAPMGLASMSTSQLRGYSPSLQKLYQPRSRGRLAGGGAGGRGPGGGGRGRVGGAGKEAGGAAVEAGGAGRAGVKPRGAGAGRAG